jgi:hypothetical protein
VCHPGKAHKTGELRRCTQHSHEVREQEFAPCTSAGAA